MSDFRGLTIQDLAAAINNKPILKGIDLTIGAGEVKAALILPLTAGGNAGLAEPLGLLQNSALAGIFSAAAESARQLRPGRSVHPRECERFRPWRFSGHYGRRG